MITAVLPAIDSAILNIQNISFANAMGNIHAPSLTAYSSVPSLQSVANHHSRAIVGCSGSSVSIGQALREQLTWASTNLGDFKRVLSNHESEVSRVLRNFDPENGKSKTVSSLSSTVALFNRRPPFSAGALEFASVPVSAEASFDASTLLQMFTATNDSAIGDAIAYWTSYAAAMSTLAADLATVSSNLLASNHGEVFNAANASLNGLAARATSIAASSEVMASHLTALPAIKTMAISALSAIEAESKALQNPAAQKAFAQAEVAAFLSGPYTAQLQTAIPRIPNLVSGDVGGGATSAATAGINVAGLGGATQAGLSPDGMNGTMQTASAPNTAGAFIPNSPNTISGMPHGGSSTPPQAGSNSAMPTSPTGGLGSAGSPPASTPFSPAVTPSGTGKMASYPATGGNSASSSSPRFSDAPPPVGIAPAATGSSPRHARATGTQSYGTSPSHVSPSTVRGSNPQNLPTGTLRNSTTPGFPRSGALGSTARYPSMGSLSSQPFSAPPLLAGSPNTPGAFPLGGAARPGLSTGTPTMGAGQSGTGGTSVLHSKTPSESGRSGLAHALSSKGGSHTRGGGKASTRRVTNVASIKDNDATTFEQNEYQRELFGDAPPTVPAVIGENVRS